MHLLSKKSKKLAVVLIIFLFAFFIITNFAIAAGTDTGLDATAGQVSNYNYKEKNNSDIPTVIGNIVSKVLAFVGLIFFILMIYAGFMWMTAGGNDEKVKKALTLVIQATTGIIIVAAAYLLTKFVGETIFTAFSK